MTEKTVPPQVHNTFKHFYILKEPLRAIWEKVFLMVLAGNSVKREDFSPSAGRRDIWKLEHSMVCVDGLCSFM